MPRTSVFSLLLVAALCIVHVSVVSAARPKGSVTPKKMALFQKWFKEQGGTVHESLQFKVNRVPLGEGSMDDEEYREPYVAVIVRNGKAAVSKGQQLVSTPTSLLLHPGLVPTTKLPAEEFADEERLVYLVAEEGRDADSKWRPWFEVLPRTFNTPLHYSDEETALLSDNPTQYGFAGAVARDERQRFNAFQKKVNALEPHPERKYSKYSALSLRWAWSIVMSRGFKMAERWSDDDAFSQRPFLAPGADFFNHANGAKSSKRVHDGQFEVVTGEDEVTEGQEVFVNYHDLPNAWLLTNYGFTLEDNEHDFVPVQLQMPFMVGTELENLRIHLLEELGLSQEIKVTSAGLTVRHQNLARVCGLNRPIGLDTRDEWIKLDMDTDLLPVDDEAVTARGLHLMAEGVQRFLKRYLQHDVYEDIALDDEWAALQAPEKHRGDDRFGWTFNGVMAARARRAEYDLTKKLLDDINQAIIDLGVSFDLDAERQKQAAAKKAEAEETSSSANAEL